MPVSWDGERKRCPWDGASHPPQAGLVLGPMSMSIKHPASTSQQLGLF